MSLSCTFSTSYLQSLVPSPYLQILPFLKSSNIESAQVQHLATLSPRQICHLALSHRLSLHFASISTVSPDLFYTILPKLALETCSLNHPFRHMFLLLCILATRDNELSWTQLRIREPIYETQIVRDFVTLLI